MNPVRGHDIGRKVDEEAFDPLVVDVDNDKLCAARIQPPTQIGADIS